MLLLSEARLVKTWSEFDSAEGEVIFILKDNVERVCGKHEKTVNDCS